MMKNVKIINEAFSNCFSNFDLVGLNNLLGDDKKFSKISTNEFLIHVRELFESYKKEKIYNLSSKSITCNNCEKGCNGFIFIDEKYKNFYSLINSVLND
ncbi:hypothetical protein RCH18_002999 [Flavobacterium sp. PL11]|nr:hypothetical protein [Flavobacterium sp. PL11]